MKRLRPLFAVVGTIAAGALAGYVVAAFVSPLLPGPTQPGDRHEQAYTREFVLAFLEQDAETVNRLLVPRNAADRAVIRKAYEEASGLAPMTLTYLGGSANQVMGSYVYVLGVEADDGSTDLLPFTLITTGSKIMDLRLGGG